MVGRTTTTVQGVAGVTSSDSLACQPDLLESDSPGIRASQCWDPTELMCGCRHLSGQAPLEEVSSSVKGHASLLTSSNSVRYFPEDTHVETSPLTLAAYFVEHNGIY